jgi:hypothetical protein
LSSGTHFHKLFKEEEKDYYFIVKWKKKNRFVRTAKAIRLLIAKMGFIVADA